MVRSGGESPAKSANPLPASVPDIGHALRLAREMAELTVSQAAERAGLASTQLVALENGSAVRGHDRIETLRTLRAYANSLGLPGNDYVLVAVEEWPSLGPILTSNGDTAVVPVVSISSAPAGGHSPPGAWGSGVPDAATGVIESVPPLSAPDTGRVPVVDTGQTPAVDRPAPAILKVLVGVVAFLVVLAAAALVENTHLDGWAHDARTTTAHWYHNAESAVGITSNRATHRATPASHRTVKAAKVTAVADPATKSVTIDVNTSPIAVKVVASQAPCWVSAFTTGHPPIFSGVLAAGQAHTFNITGSMTIETGSSAGRVFIYKGTKLIGNYVPTAVPFQLHFNATG